MAQLSRPYQIALGVMLLFGLVWAVALHGHASNPSAPAPATPAASTPAGSTTTSNAEAEAKAAAAPTPIYHGAAPGVEGLTRAIAKAHGAVKTSQQNAEQLQRKSNEASSEPQVSATASGPVAAHSSAGTGTATRKGTSHLHRHPGVAPSKKGHNERAPEQVAVEHELSQGKTVMLVFWNPKSTVDAEVQAQAKVLANHSKGRVTLHAARANQVGMFGSITEVAHVYQTPTILIVNKQGVVSTLTGLTDVFSLEQAVREARNASA